ncbi:MAG: hypothetical protein A2V66_02675 [Ignavibacteria bacterium RBG_13_36_8]|nr:MAG: hypothetical protein A2V66_02675 [Ignavibacteria bacterium RBG_13_36_8]
MKKALIILFIMVIPRIDTVYPQISRETRAVWVTTNIRLDWPPPTFNQDSQKNALVEIFNNIKNKKLNTVYFQVRSSATVMFNSSFDPYSPYLTGEVGGIPSYDPLDLAIKSAHHRGLELHAWVNVIRCFSGEDGFIFNNSYHISKRKPEWVVEFKENGKSTYWLDPGLPEVREYLVALIVEMVKQYEIDGVHLDFLRYPGKNFDDVFSYGVYGNGLNRDDWRRNNLTLFVEELSRRIKSIKPYIKLGVTPIGIYRNLDGMNGWEGYNSVYQDTREWLQRKLIDYAVPQIYWSFDSNPKFDVLAKDWNDNSFGRNIILGIGAYKPEVMAQIENIIDFSREINSQGIAFFRYGFIKDYNFKSFEYRTFPSAMAWIDDIRPLPPIDLSYDILGYNPLVLSLVWNISEHSLEENRIGYYSLYSLPETSSSFAPENLFEVIEANNKNIALSIPKPGRVEYHFAVKSVDKTWNESSTSSNIVNVTIPELESLLQKYSVYNKPALIKRSDSIVKILLMANDNEEIEVSAGNSVYTKLLFSKKLLFGKNILSLDSALDGFTFIRIKYKLSGREVNLNL